MFSFPGCACIKQREYIGISHPNAMKFQCHIYIMNYYWKSMNDNKCFKQKKFFSLKTFEINPKRVFGFNLIKKPWLCKETNTWDNAHWESFFWLIFLHFAISSARSTYTSWWCKARAEPHKRLLHDHLPSNLLLRRWCTPLTFKLNVHCLSSWTKAPHSETYPRIP